jgi:hypothetical protein
VFHQRSPLLHYLLVGLSGGPYAFYWLYLMMRDAEHMNRRRRLYPGVFLIAAMFASIVMLGSVLYAAVLNGSGGLVSPAHFRLMVVSALTLQVLLLAGVVRTYADMDPTPGLSARVKGMGGAALLTVLCLASLPYLQAKLNRFVRIRATTMISGAPRRRVEDIR